MIIRCFDSSFKLYCYSYRNIGIVTIVVINLQFRLTHLYRLSPECAALKYFQK